MLKRYRITPIRAVFWLTTQAAYWVLVWLAWAGTRERVYLGYEIFMDISARKKLSEIFSDLEPLLERARIAIAEAGSMPGIMYIVPVFCALVLFFAPFMVRRDYRRPVRGVFMLPFVTVTCYLYSQMMSIVLGACIELAMYFWIGVVPGPDFFIFLLHPLYLLWPPMLSNLPGLLSQVVYILFVMSVITVRARRVAEPEPAQQREEAAPKESAPQRGGRAWLRVHADEQEPEQSDDDARACAMELDRLCRIITTKFKQPSLVHDLRKDVSEYTANARQVADDVRSGMEHYRLVLLEAAKSMRRIIDEDPRRERAGDVFVYLVDEMERMGYCTASDSKALKNWLDVKSGH